MWPVCVLPVLLLLAATAPVLAQPADLGPRLPAPTPQLAPVQGLRGSLSAESSLHFVDTFRCRQSVSSGLPDCRWRVRRYSRDGLLEPTTEVDMLAAFRPDIPVCVFVHGSFISQAEVRDFVTMANWLCRGGAGRPLNVVMFRWPSRAGATLLAPHYAVAELGHRAEYNGFALARLLRTLPAQVPVSLVGHSHGARTVVAALHLLGGGSVRGHSLDQSGCEGKACHAVLLAAAIDQPWLSHGQKYSQAHRATRGILNVFNRNDPVLGIYALRKPFGFPALGTTGFGVDSWGRAAASAAPFRDLDVTSLIGANHLQKHFSSRPELARWIAPYVYCRGGCDVGNAWGFGIGSTHATTSATGRSANISDR